jgi:hypothetical protein
VKIRNLFVLVAMLSVFLFGIGTAHAIYGVQDDVPGQDLVWPVICAKTPSPANSLNTNWAIADLIGGSTNLAGNVIAANCVIRDITSHPIFDFGYVWTPFDVVVDNCESLVATTTPANRTALTVTLDGVQYYQGYIVCSQVNVPCLGGLTCASQIQDRFMNNVYLVDTPLGFASGFNGPTIEGNGTLLVAGSTPAISTGLGENATPGPATEIAAEDVYFRYYLDNTLASTWDWWIVLMGRNQYNTVNITGTRILDGVVCDENEHCLSVQIPVPNELNVLSVADFLPGAPLDTSYPRAGFGAFVIHESGTRALGGGGVGSFTLTGTINNPFAGATTYYSVYGWSYQRAQAASLVQDFDVIHPMLRKYCSGVPSGSGAPDNSTVCDCASTTSGC